MNRVKVTLDILLNENFPQEKFVQTMRENSGKPIRTMQEAVNWYAKDVCDAITLAMLDETYNLTSEYDESEAVWTYSTEAETF